MPGSGGTYVYLREAFQYRTGRLMPFLFIWTAILFIPLIMSTGVQGIVQYLAYLWPSMGTGQGDVVGLALVALLILMLWRRVENIGRLTVGLWAVMIVCVCTVILACFTHFHASLAFTWPAGAIAPLKGSFWIGFAGGLTIGVFDYLGYNTTAYLGAEIKDPGRVMPRSIIFSVISIVAIYVVMQIGVLGVVPLARHAGPEEHRLQLHRRRGPAADLGQGRGPGRHRARPDHRVRLGVHRPARRLPRALRRGPRRDVLPLVRPAAPQARVPHRGPAGDGRR